jgi:hypothetical protein
MVLERLYYQCMYVGYAIMGIDYPSFQLQYISSRYRYIPALRTGLILLSSQLSTAGNAGAGSLSIPG